jgi:hypothetical protein
MTGMYLQFKALISKGIIGGGGGGGKGLARWNSGNASVSPGVGVPVMSTKNLSRMSSGDGVASVN